MCVVTIMDTQELFDDMERFETGFEQAALVGDIAVNYARTRTDPRTAESIVVSFGGVEFVIGGDIVKRDEFWTVQ